MKKLYIFLFFLCFHAVAQPKRYLVHGVLNLEAETNHGISIMNKMVANGCNAVELSILWERIYAKPDSKAYWTQIDNQVNHIINNLKVKIAFRIHLGRNFATTKGFWEEEESVKCFRGNPLTVYYNNNHFSFNHQPSIDKAKAFVKEVAERYKHLQKNGQILFISVVNTPQQELGYTYENQQWPQPSYQAVYDHSKWAMIKFKDWVKEKYTTIRTLNTYWGTNYKNFSEVEPYVNWWGPLDSFRGIRGKDWYIFRHLTLRNYIDQMVETIKSVDSEYKVSCEYGGVTDNLAYLRSTLAFRDLSQKADVIKTASSGIEGDMCISNLFPHQKFFSEVAIWDLPTDEALRTYVARTMNHGVEFMALYIDYDVEKDFQKVLPAVREGTKWINIPVGKVEFAEEVSYRVSQLIDTRDEVVNDWKTRSGNGEKIIKINLDEDILKDNKKIENPLPDLPNQTGGGPPPKETGPNILPKAGYNNFTQEVVVGQTFQFRLPDNLFTDPDGFISFIEMIDAPSWISFNRFENSFTGKAQLLGKTKIRLKVYDNKGDSIESSIFIEATPPTITFELIKADYFDVPIIGLGNMVNDRVISLADIPEKTNIIARCNLDSVVFEMELTGAFKHKTTLYRPIYNLFGEGRGIQLPVGNYTLKAEARRKDSLVTWKTVTFRVVASTSPADSVLADWTAYPIPFSEICNIKLPAEEDFSQLSFFAYTSTGQKFQIQKSNISYIAKTASIDFEKTNLPAGNYTIEITKGEAILRRFRVSKTN